MTGTIQPQLEKELAKAYPPYADGPYVGKLCSRDGCKELARFAVTPLGLDTAIHAGLTCGRHVMPMIGLIADDSGKSVVVQEVPRMVRYHR